MPVISVRIPQMGEGLQEARLVAVLKQPGETIKRDEPIYQMETDKAVMDVESPYEGKLVSWLAEVDAVLPIGTAVAQMEVADGVSEMQVHGAPEAPAPAAAQPEPEPIPEASAGARNASVPPRTRAYAKEKGVSEAELATLAAGSGKLMPADIDSFLASRSSGAAPQPASRPTGGAGGPSTEVAMTGKQRVLASRLVRSSQLVVPGTITVVANWGPVEAVRAEQKAKGGDFQPSTFTMFAFAVARALKDHPLFRSNLKGDDTIRTYATASLGIAVALPGDELVTAVVEEADALNWKDFASRCRAQIDLARQGKDQANEAVTLSLTNMQNFGLRQAVPVLVAPSVGVLFLGEVFPGLKYDENGGTVIQRSVNLTLTFDHRLINGVGATDFLTAIKMNLESIRSLVNEG
ncbi:MAG: 2-oxo acid dehydrogenase subunit E2 [Armatimonadetes bacterium]|nr:2-oxo acid dehydrogenase subunit E2 [Armatimonadota bacterium]